MYIKLEYSITREFTYLYDESGMIGFMYSYEGATPQAYYYQRNLQGDVIAIYDTAGAVQAKYSYDAYGNCAVTNSTNLHLATYNPIRYRGYYFDDETGWYFLNARYYSPEWRRFISPDDTAYIDPESANGLHLYCYCNNDPINYADPSGHEPEWWQWVLFGIGVALVAVAAGMAIFGTGGVAAFGMGALIGSAAVGTVGAGIGAAVGYAANGTEGILGGAMAGFGIGAIVGFVVGGAIGHSYYTSQALLRSYKVPDSEYFDCSEIADDLYKLANKKGKILNITAKNNSAFKIPLQGDGFYYHTVYSRGMFILDPRYSPTNPIFRFAYMQAIQALNEGIKFLITRG